MHASLLLLLPLIALALLAFALFVFLFYKVMSFSFRRMGIPRHLVVPSFIAILIGGFFNIPIWRSGEVTVAVNVGGAIIPSLISIYLLRKAPLLKTAIKKMKARLKRTSASMRAQHGPTKAAKVIDGLTRRKIK